MSEGEIFGFLGPNGSGKTTSIRMLCGLLTPDSGSGSCLGFDVIRDSARIKRKVGYMTQRFSLWEDLTIAENLDFVARMFGMARRRETVDRALGDLGLTSRRRQLAGTLSGAGSNAWRSPPACCTSPGCCCSTRPTAGSIQRPAVTSGRRSIASRRRESPCWCPPTTWTRPNAATASAISPTANCWHRAAPGRSCAASSWSPSRSAASGPGLAEALRKLPGAVLVASFGSTLHVSGHDDALLERSLAGHIAGLALHMRRVDTSLEDAFINLMQGSRDQFEMPA